MSIRTKLALILFVAVGAFLALDLALLRFSGARSLAAQERSRCESQMNGILRAFDATYDELASLARASTGYSAESPADSVAVTAKADLALAIDKEGRVSEYVHLDLDGAPATLREVPNQAVALAHPFMKSWLTGTPPRGLFETTKGLMLIGSAVDHVDGEPQLSIRGRWLNAETLGAVQAIAGSTFQCRSIHELSLIHICRCRRSYASCSR